MEHKFRKHRTRQVEISLVTLLLLTPLAMLRAADKQNAARADVGAASSAVAVRGPLRLPKPEDFQLFLLLGQSNMVGRGQMTQLPPHPRLLTFDKEMRWKEAVDPLHETSSRDRAGPERKECLHPLLVEVGVSVWFSLCG